MPVPDVNVVSLLHFDGANAGTTFTDESGKTWTPTGNAQTSTAQKKFGTTSGLFDGTGDYLTTPNNAAFNFGSADFTIDFWAYLNATSSYLLNKGGLQTSSQFGWEVYFFNGIPNFAWSTTGANRVGPVTAGILGTGAWGHIAVVNSSGNLTVYLNGVAGTPSAIGTIFNDGLSLYLGNNVRDPAFLTQYNGYIDELRISNVARWTANFTPPAYPYGYNAGQIIISSE